MRWFDWYANHDRMEFRDRRALGFTVLFAIVIAGCATAGARSQSVTAEPAAGGTVVASAAPTAAAEPLPPDTAPTDAKRAFVAGYQAYLGHDYPRAITNLTFAAANYPTLADYALFYLAQAQADRGDQTAAVATFERLRAEYPQSVLTPRGELALAQIFLKLGRNADANSVATHIVAVAGDPFLNQNARMVQAQALAAMGQNKAAYNEAMALREAFPHGIADSRARGLAYCFELPILRSDSQRAGLPRERSCSAAARAWRLLLPKRRKGTRACYHFIGSCRSSLDRSKALKSDPEGQKRRCWNISRLRRMVLPHPERSMISRWFTGNRSSSIARETFVK